jgi:two-component sensor histidine kinase
MEAAALHEVLLADDGSVADFKFIAANEEFSRLSGMPAAALIGKTVLDCFPGVDQEWLRLYTQVAVTGTAARIKTYSTFLGLFFDIRAFRVEDGVLACLFSDITESQQSAEALKRSEAQARRLVDTICRSESTLAALLDEKDALLKEVHHRVKNNLQVIVSLMNIERSTLDGTCPSAAVLARMQDRILAMAEVHDALYHSPTLAAANLSAAFHSLAGRLAETYEAEAHGIRIEVEDSELLLPLDRAVPCCLAVNELVANALLHAFPDGWQKEKAIRLSADLIDKGRVLVSVEDNGVGMPNAAVPGSATSGLSLARLLVDQLGGELRLIAENGTAARLTFGLP